MIDNRNLILAVVLSLAILIGFQYLVVDPQQQRLAEQQPMQRPAETSEPAAVPRPGAVDAPTQPRGEAGTGVEVSAAKGRETALQDSPRVAIESQALVGTIALKGARVDDLILTRYRETVEADSAQIELLSPAGTARPYFADFGWSSGDRALELPNGETLWQADGEAP